MEDNQKALKAQKEYDDYFDMKKLPDLSVPANVRDVLYCWKQSLQEHWDQQINWWLKCDQRSLLTQESTPDIRRFAVKNSRIETGKFYGKKIRELLKVHEKVLNAIDTWDQDQGNRFKDLQTVELL